MKKLVCFSVLFICISFFSIQGKVKYKVNLFNLKEVRLLDSPFYEAQQRDLEYIFALDPDRLLAPFLREAGLETKALSYTNWENSGLDGHIGGHYLSALSKMYASTENKEVLLRLNYMLSELKRCQDAVGSGFIGGTPNSLSMWDEIKNGNIRAGGFSLNEKWVPLYNIHKTYAGLRDAYLYADSELAFELLIKLTDWMIDITSALSDGQMQDMLRSEHGGLNEVFADVADLTGDTKYLHLARRFSHQEILNPLLKKEDQLTGMHANTQIPKVIGYKRIADLEENKTWDDASWFFWNTVVHNRTINIGGNSVREHFHPSDNFLSMVEDREGPETCNTYNMLRLSGMLYKTSLNTELVDYYERALYNHILSTIEPNNGGFVYFTSMRPGHYRVYSQPETSFWCCVGSGLENHAQYGEFIYGYSDDNLYVNLFIPSTLNWRNKGIQLTQETCFPETNEIRIRINECNSKSFILNFRHPSWAKSEIAVSLNGRKIDAESHPGDYISIDRKWKKGDVISFTLPMNITLDRLPANGDYYSFRYGPIVLAAKVNSEDLEGLYADDSRMGHIAQGKLMSVDETPTLIGNPAGFIDQIKRSDTKPLSFIYEGEAVPICNYLELVPFYALHNARYVVYFRQIESVEKLEQIKRKETERIELEAQTVDVVYAGEQQPESDHHIEYEDSEVDTYKNKRYRKAKGWFSYDMKVKETANKLLVTVKQGEEDFSIIYINNTPLNVEPTLLSTSENFSVLEYVFEEPLMMGTYKLQFIPKKKGSWTASVFEVR
ncbi:MAG: glycosyl hydrolase, partial [Bacteroidales bacterium]|nr:glycosyl hydrolase [Bacteroidales bacterium]